jgi:hypothetical protein
VFFLDKLKLKKKIASYTSCRHFGLELGWDHMPFVCWEVKNEVFDKEIEAFILRWKLK